MVALADAPVIILAFVFLASIAAFFLVRRNRRWGEGFALVSSILVFLTILSLYPALREGGPVVSAYTFFSFPLAIHFRVDHLGYSMALLISFLWVLAVIYSRAYMAHNHALDRYYGFLLAALGASLGIVMAGDMLGLLLFFELMAVTSYVLVIHEEDPPAMFAGGKYIYMAMAAGFAVFFSTILLYFEAGDLAFGSSGLLTDATPFTLAIFLGFLTGFGIKAGAFPLHVWLPDAHPAAPAPVSALLSGVMVKIGVFGLIRVFYEVFSIGLIQQAGWHRITLALAVITILLGSALALRQDDLKRRLAYSTIAQVGYIYLGLSLLTEVALTGALFHIFAHAMMKGCLFLCAGAIILQTGKRRISHLGGIGLKMPLTMACFTLAALSMVGIPPFNGFLSKLLLSLGALDAGAPAYVFLLIISSLLNAAYYLPIVVAAFFAPPGETGGKSLEAPPVMLAPIIVLAAGTFVFALAPANWPLEMARLIAGTMIKHF